MPNNRPNNRGGERVYFVFLFPLSFPPPILFQGNPDSTSNQSIQFQFPNCFCKATEFSYSFVRTFIQDFLHNAVLRVIFHPERYITEMEKKREATRRRFLPTGTNRPSTLPSPLPLVVPYGSRV